MKQPQRTPALFGLFAASLIACSSGGTGTPPLGDKTLSLRAQANDYPLTVFVNAGNGNLIDSKTLATGSGEQTLTFTNLPSDATVSSAYETSYVRSGVTVPNRNITTLPIAAVNNLKFSSPTNGTNQTVAALYAKFTGKPNLTDFSYVSAFNVQTSFAFDGTNYYLNLKSDLSKFDLQKDGKFTPIFFAFNSKNEPIGYVAFPDKTVPASENSFDNPDFLVSPSDWKTDFKTLSINLENATNSEYILDIYGTRKDIEKYLYARTSRANTSATAITLSAKYPPSIFDEYKYYVSKFTAQDTQIGRPSQGSTIFKRGLSNLPESPTIPAFNAQTDFLPTPTNLVYAEASRPTLSWNLAAPSSVTFFGVSLYDQVDNLDQYWNFIFYPKTSTSLVIPELPANLSSFDPKGNGSLYRFNISISDYNSATSSPSGYRYAGASRNFADDVGPAALKTQNVRPELIELHSHLPKGVELR
jgi:hypothetical protein